jgi:hypothetical protein
VSCQLRQDTNLVRVSLEVGPIRRRGPVFPDPGCPVSAKVPTAQTGREQDRGLELQRWTDEHGTPMIMSLENSKISQRHARSSLQARQSQQPQTRSSTEHSGALPLHGPRAAILFHPRNTCLYRRATISSSIRAVIEVRWEPPSTWAVTVTTASLSGEIMQSWPYLPAILYVFSPGVHQTPRP